VIEFNEFMPDATGAPAGGELETLRLNETPVLVALFTGQVEQTQTHFVEAPNLRAELHCHAGDGSPCLLCDLKYKRTRRAILPVYDVETDQVKVLLVSDSRHPHALGPLLKAELAKGGLDQRYLLLSRQGAKFAVQSVPAPDGGRMGESAIAEFLAGFEGGQLDLTRAIPLYPNEELWDVPEVERKARALGLERSRYVAGRGRPEQGAGARETST
jgi:hypothetical protein